MSLKSYVDRRLADLLIIGALIFIVFAMIQQTLGFLFQDRFGYAPVAAAGQVGFTLMLSAMASLVGQILLVQRFALRGEKLLLVMLPLMIAGFSLIFWSTTPALVRTAIILIGLGMGLGLPGVSGCASLRMGPSEQGVVAGMVNACPAFGFIIGPLLGTGLYQWNPVYCYGAVLFLMLPLSVLVIRLNFRKA